MNRVGFVKEEEEKKKRVFQGILTGFYTRENLLSIHLKINQKKVRLKKKKMLQIKCGFVSFLFVFPDLNFFLVPEA